MSIRWNDDPGPSSAATGDYERRMKAIESKPWKRHGELARAELRGTLGDVFRLLDAADGWARQVDFPATGRTMIRDARALVEQAYRFADPDGELFGEVVDDA